MQASTQVRLSQRLLRALLFVWGTVILNVVVGTVANVNTTQVNQGTSLRASLSQMFLGRLIMFHPFLVIGSLVLLIVLTLVAWLGSREPASSSAGTSSLSAQNRTHLLGRLGILYQQMSEQSLQDAVRIDLNLAIQPTAVQNAASLSLHLHDQPKQSLPPGTTISQAYHQAQEELLILGEPGAGKSTLLIELASHLIELARQDTMQPLPALIPLSTWAKKRLPLQEWLIEQFAQLYAVPRKLSQQLIEGNLILPLLDGLDEIDEALRPGCIKAINAYHQTHLGPLVVCSRTDDYTNAVRVERLALHTAIVVQPLSMTQIDAHLVSLGNLLTDLRTALKQQPYLQEIATTPLMLQVLQLTYQGSPVPQLSQQKSQVQTRIWTDYVERMISRKVAGKGYPLLKTIPYLTWLASHMRQHNQTIFFLEQLQPTWLARRSQRILYSGNITVLITLLSGLYGGLMGDLFRGLPTGLLCGLVFGLNLRRY